MSFVHVDQLMEAVLNILPNATIGEDSEGQIIVYTNYKTIEDDGSIQDMDELKEVLDGEV